MFGSQVSFFDGDHRFKIEKPIRLIELFAGYGSQHLALKYLGADVESWRISEWAVNSIQAYKDLHFAADDTDYSKDLDFKSIVDFLFKRGISADYNQPMRKDQIKRMGEKRCRKVYNNIQATHNLVSVCNIHADELGITDTDKFCYIMTYSFPCQDLSVAGLQKGMDRDSGTRSGLLLEVERILKECDELPQVLLMENVPNVHGKKNKDSFRQWIECLESLGYKNYWQDLNAKEYGYPHPIPQNRNRCFMVSILGNYYYEFPQKQKLDLKLKDLLEENVDKKYYLSEKTIFALNQHLIRNLEKGNGFGWKVTDGGGSLTASRQKADTDLRQTLFLVNQGTVPTRFTDVSQTIQARDYKGFGNQEMVGVVEFEKGE